MPFVKCPELCPAHSRDLLKKARKTHPPLKTLQRSLPCGPGPGPGTPTLAIRWLVALPFTGDLRLASVKVGATPWNHLLTLYKQLQELAMAEVCGTKLG